MCSVKICSCNTCHNHIKRCNNTETCWPTTIYSTRAMACRRTKTANGTISAESSALQLVSNAYDVCSATLCRRSVPQQHNSGNNTAVHGQGQYHSVTGRTAAQHSQQWMAGSIEGNDSNETTYQTMKERSCHAHARTESAQRTPHTLPTRAVTYSPTVFHDRSSLIRTLALDIFGRTSVAIPESILVAVRRVDSAVCCSHPHR